MLIVRSINDCLIGLTTYLRREQGINYSYVTEAIMNVWELLGSKSLGRYKGVDLTALDATIHRYVSP